MEWPTTVTIVDDMRHARLVADLLTNIAWINKPPDYVLNEVVPGALGKDNLREEDVQQLLAKVRDAVKELAESQPEYFRDKTEFIHVRNENDVMHAIQRLRQPGPALAFIDFNYGKAKDAHLSLRREYEQISDEWKLAGDEDEVVLFGGESSCKGFADAARCACDERYLHRSLSVSTGVTNEK